MQLTPEMPPELKGGLLGLAIFIILSLAAVIAWLIKDRVSGAGPKTGGSPGPPRELTAGEKTPDYWERIFAEIETEGNRALLLALSEQHRSTMEMLGKLRARLRESDQAATAQALKEFRAKYDHDIVSIAKMLRAIEEKFER